MKFLILGASGMAGHTVSLYLHLQGHDVTTFTTQPFPYFKNIVGDAMNSEQLRKILLEGNYDTVINCIGLLNQMCDREPSKAVYLNSYLPHFIVDVLKNTKTKLIHMSTDCVFSGEIGNYQEHSLRDGLTFYDRTKALGEIDDEKNLTFRNSIIGLDMNVNGIGLFNWFMKQNSKIEGYTRAIWTGVTTLTLAKAMERAASENITGIYNLVNNEIISKYELLLLFNRIFKYNHLLIQPTESISLNKSLVNTRSDFTFRVPSYEQMIIEMKEWYDSHKDLYPHYKVD